MIGNHDRREMKREKNRAETARERRQVSLDVPPDMERRNVALMVSEMLRSDMPENPASFLHADALALRYKLPFVPFVTMAHNAVTYFLNAASSPLRIPIPAGSTLARFTAQNGYVYMGVGGSINAEPTAGNPINGVILPTNVVGGLYYVTGISEVSFFAPTDSYITVELWSQVV